MVKKILSVILIVLGSIVVLANLLTLINPVPPESTETAYMIGYYIGTFSIFILGAALIFFGIRIRRRLKRKRVEKNLLDSLPR